MPVSYLPCVTWILLIAIPLVCLIRGRRPFYIAASVSTLLVAAFLLSIFVPGLLLHSNAGAGAPQAQYEYARWRENHCEQINAVLLWPCQPDVLGGYAWLEKAAAQDYPTAVWLVGVRLKYGLYVPRPANWQGPAGNCFPQPERGQAMINRAVNELGFVPPPNEETYYYTVYRR